jgi:hypothetical protein
MTGSVKNRAFNSSSYSATVAQIIFTGVDALPTISFIGLATGFIFTFRLIAISNSLYTLDKLQDIYQATNSEKQAQTEKMDQENLRQ